MKKTWYVYYWTTKANSSLPDDLKNNFDERKTKFTKLETDLNIARNVNFKPSDRLINVE